MSAKKLNIIVGTVAVTVIILGVWLIVHILNEIIEHEADELSTYELPDDRVGWKEPKITIIKVDKNVPIEEVLEILERKCE